MRALTFATVFAAASGYLVMLIAGRALGPADYPLFATYWGAFFALGGVAEVVTTGSGSGWPSNGARSKSMTKLRAPLPLIEAPDRDWRTCAAGSLSPGAKPRLSS